MRTTLDLDDDVLQAAKELARRDGRTAGAVVSELARRGLRGSASAEAQAPQGLRRGVPVLPSRGDVVTIERVNRLRELEGV